ncbi:diguanylate cyclase [Marinobacter bryozoorum]|uniref:sensor domain-containing diguanylate cyclase n=1 Tax=Marinobacter bryozoorum TaxID=256324 RepID=UPI002006B7EA|nr:sensor domain-containing diguanylate cyclase [Marinobacter bryozoorum]MCK7545607.1 diguanylate cyclase [Marinobacter bryozoorum]
MNRRNRSVSFVAAFLTLASHVWLQQLSPWLYPTLAVSFLVWPQLAYLRARQSADSMHSEFNNLVIDAVIFGLWIAGLGFPVWITFILGISITMNLMVFRGLPGTFQALTGLAGGVVAGGLFAGFWFQPATHWITTVLAISSISMYLLLVGHVSFSRNLILHDARERQRLTEQELKRQIEENRLLQEQLQEQANRDPLTGLYNRRYLEDSLHREMTRCLRQGDPLSLVLIDLDHFKGVNDLHGHSAGDLVINQLASVLTALSRGSDIVCRFGGEEFLVVLPGTGLEAAEARAEDYRRMFEKTPVAMGENLFSVTLSAGVACSYREVPPDELIRQADLALYEAKEAGRNRVVCRAPWTGEAQRA